MGQVDDPVRLVLTLELATTAEPIAGFARAGEAAGQAFSGWSELFAVLPTLLSQAGSAKDGPVSLSHQPSRGRTGPGRPD
jgi:hypothetical protein